LKKTYKQHKNDFRKKQINSGIKILNKITWKLRILEIVNTIFIKSVQKRISLMEAISSDYLNLFETMYEDKFYDESNRWKKEAEFTRHGFAYIYQSLLKKMETDNE
jgi:hypothetical protein